MQTRPCFSSGGRFRLRNLWREQAVLSVTLPFDVGQVRIDAHSCQIRADSIACGVLEMAMQNGRIKCSDVLAEEISIACVNGCVQVVRPEVGSLCAVEVVNGSALVEDVRPSGFGYAVSCAAGRAKAFGEAFMGDLVREGQPMVRIRVNNGLATLR